MSQNPCNWHVFGHYHLFCSFVSFSFSAYPYNIISLSICTLFPLYQYFLLFHLTVVNTSFKTFMSLVSFELFLWVSDHYSATHVNTFLSTAPYKVINLTFYLYSHSQFLAIVHCVMQKQCVLHDCHSDKNSAVHFCKLLQI